MLHTRATYRRVQQSSESQNCTGGSHRHKHNATKQHQSVPTFFMINWGVHGATAENPPDAAPRRLRAAPAAPQLRTPRSRLPGRQRRLLEPAAASAAAAAAARLLLQMAAGDARAGACAAATACSDGCSDGHTGGGASVHAAAITPAAPAALAAALAAAAVDSAPSRGLQSGHAERAETRPGSPTKDKPAARRPPAGLRITDPFPPDWSSV